MKKYLVEFIGTFFLMISIVCAVNSNLEDAIKPLAIGSMLIVMVYSCGHISGAHFNPAVTLGIYLRGKCALKEVPGYIIAQIVGAILAVYIGCCVFGRVPDISPVDMNLLQAGLGEFLGTFALVWVILNVAFTKSNEGNSHYGLAIGFTVIGCAYAFGGFGSYGCFNPAVAIGTLINGLNTSYNAVFIIIINFTAGALAALAFKALYTAQNADD